MTRYTRFPPGSIPLAARAGGPGRPDAPVVALDPAPSDAPARGPAPRAVGRGRAEAPAAAAAPSRLPLVVLLFLVSLVIPVFFYAGSLRLSPMRLVLLATFVPVAVAWVSGGSGRVRMADLTLLGYSVWMVVTFLSDGGRTTPEYAAVSVIETVTPYLIARRFVRSEADHAAVIRAFFWIAVLLLPGAAIEAVTGIRIYNKLFSFMRTLPWANYEQRLHMFRAQTVFEHPILFGVFSAALLAPVYTWARLRMSRGRATLLTMPVVGCTFFSLSSGGYMGLNIQLIFMLWGFVFSRVQGRWKVFTVLFAIGYAIVELGSNRTAFQVLSSYLAFNSSTAYWRVLILNFGMENVWAHPLLGLGQRDWVRPAYMHSASVDNFWLLQAMRHGIPGFLLMAATYGLCMRQLIAARPEGRMAQGYRDALAFALIGMAISIITVHIWSATFGFFMFLLGSTAWFGEARPAGAGAAPGPEPEVSRGAASRVAAPARTASDRAIRTTAPGRAGALGG